MVQFNKMFVMLPLMFAARKLDGEDPQTVYWLRIAYAVVQTLCVLAVVYTYVKASAVVNISNVVYVPPAPQVSESRCSNLIVFAKNERKAILFYDF